MGDQSWCCSEEKAAGAAVGDMPSVDDSWGLEAARDLCMWGWFLLRNQDWFLSHIQDWSLGHNQGGVPVVVNWHPAVPGRSELVGRAAVCEMVALHWLALGVHGLLHDHIHNQDRSLAKHQHQP